MAALTRSRNLDLADDLPSEARAKIKSMLESEPQGTRKIYAALARKVWGLLVERRFDDEIRDWHDLVRGAKARMSEADPAVAERLAALGDLLRESISLAQTSPARAVANRPRARSILEILSRSNSTVARRQLLTSLGIGSSHLSNILTQLVAHALVERRGVGKEAEFRITNLGRQLIGADAVRADVAAGYAESIDKLSARLKSIDFDVLDRLQDGVIRAYADKERVIGDNLVIELNLNRNTVMRTVAFEVKSSSIGTKGIHRPHQLIMQRALISALTDEKSKGATIAGSR